MKLIRKWVLVLSVAVAGAVSIPAGQVAANRTNEYSPQKLASWRAKGPDGLAQFVALHQKELDKSTLNPPKDNPQWTQLCMAMDVIGGQKDNYASRLYWFTDLSKAKVLSKTEHKPILSLRLLGNLTDELSCANSRFFRTALYPNAKINALLQNKFVLYWSSERPAPIVTIDMGDGRKIKRTVTGNSVHYLLSSDGTPLDVLPGLNAPGTFERWLADSLQLYTSYEAKPQNERAAFLAKTHEELLEASLLNARKNDPVMKASKIDLAATVTQIKKRNPLLTPAAPRVSALLAAPLPVGKAVLEMPLLKETKLMQRDALDSILSFSDVAAARPYLKDAQLDANSVALIRAKNPPLDTTPVNLTNTNPYFVSIGSASSDNSVKDKLTPFQSLINNFERALAIDSARNNDLHNYIHAYFADGKQGDFEELNKNVYGRLFRTPQSDAWLGLDTPGIYTAINNGGITKN